MKKDIYFGTYKNSNVNKLNNYIKLIDEINSKYYNFGFPFTKGDFDLNYHDYVKDKKLNYNSKNPEDVFEEISYLYQCIPNWNNPGTMINVIPPANLLSTAIVAYTNLFNPNFAQDTYAGYLIASEFEVIKYMSDLMEWDYKKSRGIFTFGGKGTNLYATKIALKKADSSISKCGCSPNKYFMITSKHAHPCHYQVCDWLGIGSDNCIEISCLPNGQINLEEAEKTIQENLEKGKMFLGYNLNGGSTNDLIIDPIKEIYDLNKRIIKKYKLNYSPHIHVDFVLGWILLFFKDYHTTKKSLKPIMELKKYALEVKYADSVGIDFHKTGFCPYISSLFMVKSNDDFSLLNSMENKELKDLHYGNYNPYNSTLELTRSSSGAIGALVCLKSLGIKGFQEIYINMFEGTYRIRELLSKEKGVCVLNQKSNGLVTFFIIKPPQYKTLSIEEIIKLPSVEIEFIKKYNIGFSKFILDRAKNNLINFTFTSSRSYKYNGTNISLGALKIYPISVFFDKEEATKLVENIINEIKVYKDNTKSYENEISISDDMVYKERR